MIHITEKSKKELLRAKIKELIIITVLYPVNKCRFDVLLLLYNTNAVLHGCCRRGPTHPGRGPGGVAGRAARHVRAGGGAGGGRHPRQIQGLHQASHE